MRLFALVRAACAVCAVTLVLAGCGGDDGDPSLKRAQSRVTKAQEALADAKAELATRTTEFCTSTATYLTALDRYGDILTATAPTVGDVKDAGRSLDQPRDDVVAKAGAVTEAQTDVADAEKELAEATAALAAAQAKASGQPTPTPSPAGSSAPPLVSATTVNRVKQADADFTTAQQGITDQTPLKQASQQFNAAAVALEMSWLRLFAEAGCLTDEQQKQAETAVRTYTSALQRSLADAGYYQGPVDGVYGPATVDAVSALQKAHGLPVTGTVDKATDAALQADLQAKGGAAAQQATASTAAVQQTLKLAGYWTGPVDGAWTPALTEALKNFQVALGVPPTGTVDAATIAALQKAIADAKQPAPPPPSTAPSPSRTG
jgi:murein L,D-transpeptidase YcbB/YkuD